MFFEVWLLKIEYFYNFCIIKIKSPLIKSLNLDKLDCQGDSLIFFLREKINLRKKYTETKSVFFPKVAKPLTR